MGKNTEWPGVARWQTGGSIVTSSIG